MTAHKVRIAIVNHTTGRTADHSVDAAEVSGLLEQIIALRDPDHHVSIIVGYDESPLLVGKRKTPPRLTFDGLTAQ